MKTTTSLGGRPINRMGFGAMQLAGPGVFGPPRDPAEARAVLRRAVELGVDHIDTSQYYGPDVVNDLIRETLYPYPDGLRLVTKVGWRRDGAGGILPAQSPGELREGVEANLRSLRVERLDLVNLRLPDDGGPGGALEDQLGALDELRRQGKIDLIGLSNVDRATLERGLELVDVAGIQNAYSVMDRHDDDLLAYCEEREIAFVPFGPLGSAYRRGPARLAAESAIAQAAAKHESTPSQIALAWLLARSERMLLIPGTSSVAHLEENIAARTIELDEADLAALDRVGLRSVSE
jgi:aryl-alcohol dehydrogenase-like predicted oxidoreductase